MSSRVYSLLVATLLFLTFGVPAMPARAQEQDTDGPGPQAVEATFSADFESEPADLSPQSFSLVLGNERFDFTFTDEGDSYLGNGFSHSPGFGDGGSGSIFIRSAANNFDTMERIEIARNDGGLFIFDSIFLNNRDESGLVTVQGLRNGVPVGELQSVSINSADTLLFSGLLVDEIWLTSWNFWNTHMDSFTGSTTVPMDYGDLPDSYDVTAEADDGARHPLGSLFLGNCIDAEADGQASPNADGDDVAGGSQTNGSCAIGGDDEDGLIPITPWQNGAGGGTVQTTITGGDGCLSGWIDWDNDGRFVEAGDQVLDMEPVSSGTFELSFDVPAGVFSGGASQPAFYARFRLIEAGQGSDCSDVPALAVNGAAGAGEVEDHVWALSSTAIKVGEIEAGARVEESATVPLLGLVALLGVLSIMANVARRKSATRWHRRTTDRQ